MKQLKRILWGALVSIALTSCADPIEKVVQANIDGFNNRSLDEVMATIDDKSPYYEATKKTSEELINAYNLQFEIQSMSITRRPQDESKQMQKIQEENQDGTGLDALLDDAAITEEDRARQEERKRAEAAKLQNRALQAEVKVVQVTRSTDVAGTYKDNQINVVHTLHKYPTDENPEWKIFKSEVRKAAEIGKEG